MKGWASFLIVSHLSVAGFTYLMTDRRPIDEEAHHTGFFRLDTRKILATTVESLRAQNQLLVFSYKGSATVMADTQWLWLFSGYQELSVPAVVSYYVNLADLSLADVDFDERTKLVTVHLPKLTLGDIAFQPEHATTVNGGVLSWNERQGEALRRFNYLSARRAMVAQAQQPSLLDAARRQAIADVESYFEVPLRIVGQPDIKVVATID